MFAGERGQWIGCTATGSSLCEQHGILLWEKKHDAKVIFFLSLKRFHMNSNIAGEGNECVGEDGNEMPEGLLFDDEIDDSIVGQWIIGVDCHVVVDHVLFNEVDGSIDHVIGKAHLDGVLAGGLDGPVHGAVGIVIGFSGQVAAGDGDLRIHVEGDREDLADCLV